MTRPTLSRAIDTTGCIIQSNCSSNISTFSAILNCAVKMLIYTDLISLLRNLVLSYANNAVSFPIQSKPHFVLLRLNSLEWRCGTCRMIVNKFVAIPDGGAL